MPVVTDILEEYASRTLDESLHSLSLYQQQAVVGSGTGHLSVRKDGKLVLEIFVSWPLKTKPSESRTGSVIPSSEFLRAEADTQRGLKFVADKLYVPHGRRILFPRSVRLILSEQEFLDLIK